MDAKIEMLFIQPQQKDLNKEEACFINQQLAQSYDKIQSYFPIEKIKYGDSIRDEVIFIIVEIWKQL